MRVVLLVIRRVRDFQILDGQPGDIIHGDLEIHGAGPDLFSALRGSGLAQSDFGDEGVLVPTLELLDCPLANLLLVLVLEALALDALRQLK